MSVLKHCVGCDKMLSMYECYRCKTWCKWAEERILWRDASEVSDWKMQYNIYLGRHNKAAEYMDNQDVPIEKREHWLNVYRAITMELNYILALFNTDKIPYTDQEALEGFNVQDT